MTKPVSITTSVHDDYSYLHVDCEDDLLPEQLMALSTPRLDLKKGVLIGNKHEPLLIAYLTSIYRNANWVGVHYGKNGRYMIVIGNRKQVKIGQILGTVGEENGERTIAWD